MTLKKYNVTLKCNTTYINCTVYASNPTAAGSIAIGRKYFGNTLYPVYVSNVSKCNMIRNVAILTAILLAFTLYSFPI